MAVARVTADSELVAAVRRVALAVCEAGLAAADPGAAVRRIVEPTDTGFRVGGVEYPVAGRLVLLGAGKASLRIARALEETLGDRIDSGLVVVRRGESGRLRRCRVVEADHPVPTESSVAAARDVLALAASLGPDDVALCCMTGGSSALLSLPPDGVSAADKFELHTLLLASGADVVEMNAVRKHVSAVKAGRVALAAAPATVVNLTVSDVAGDRMDCISDPTVADHSTADEAITVLRRYGLWDKVAASVRDHLESGTADSPALAAGEHTTLLVNGAIVCDAMIAAATDLGYRGSLLSTVLVGEACDIGAKLAAAAREAVGPCVLVACGGEATVTLPDWHAARGRGGPNQEVAVAAALALDGVVAVLSIDTDGSDGATPCAGALVDSETAGRASAAGIDLAAALANHCVGAALDALDEHVVTGPTGTNVNDLVVVVVDGTGAEPR